MGEFRSWLRALPPEARELALKTELTRSVYALEKPFAHWASQLVPSFFSDAPALVAVDDAGGRIPAQYVWALARLAARDTEKSRPALVRITGSVEQRTGSSVKSEIARKVPAGLRSGRAILVTESVIGGSTLGTLAKGFAAIGVYPDVAAFQTLQPPEFYADIVQDTGAGYRPRGRQHLYVADPECRAANEAIFELEPLEDARGIDTDTSLGVSKREQAFMQAGAYGAARALAHEHFDRVRGSTSQSSIARRTPR